jgi:hypothetical protein
MNTLEQLAEKHCNNYLSVTDSGYTFTKDQLDALIREIVGEPVAWKVDNGPWAATAADAELYANRMWLEMKPLHALSVSLED